MIFALVAAAAARPASVGFVDDPVHPIRCHWERAADETRCDIVLTWASLAWDVQVDTIGFAAPLPDGDLGGSDALDIYLGVSGTSEAGEAWVDCVWDGAECADADPTDGMAAAPSYVAIDARTADDVLPGYVVHEFNHTTQYAMDYAEPFLVLWEGTAVSAEMWTLPGVDPSTSDVADYQATPWLSAVLQDGYYLWDELELWSWYEYGAMVWVRWIDARYGDGAGSGAVALWHATTQEGAGAEPDVLDAWSALAGVPWEDEMLAFAADRARMGGGDGPAWLAFAGADGRVLREAEGLVDGAEVSPSTGVFPLGAAYFDVDAQAGERWEVRLDAAAATRWGIVLVEPGAADVIATGSQAAIDIAGNEGFTVGIVNLGASGLDADDTLEAAAFTLTVSQAFSDENPPCCKADAVPCGCGTGSGGTGSGGTGSGGGAVALLVSLGLAAGRRRR